LVGHGLWQKKVLRAVNDVSFTINRGEIVGLVGESGSGKTTVGRSILRLVEPTSGEITFDGHNLLTATPRELRALRRQMQIVFQDPFASLNPRQRVFDQITAGFAIHNLYPRREWRQRAQEIFELVGLRPDHLDRFPHEFSGGQRQRIGIARALAVRPDFIIADEAVSALDVSIQAQVVNLLLDLREQLNLTILFISHDLGLVEFLCDRVLVMYLGRIVESGTAREIYAKAGHPYTQALLSAIPLPDPAHKTERLILQGDIPSPISPPSGCSFHTRCPYAIEACKATMPSPQLIEAGHGVSCLRQAELRAGL